MFEFLNMEWSGISHSSFRRKPESREASVNKQVAVYILASKRNGTLYIEVTSDLIKRYGSTKTTWWKVLPNVTVFINWFGWYEVHEGMESAIEREKRLKE